MTHEASLLEGLDASNTRPFMQTRRGNPGLT